MDDREEGELDVEEEFLTGREAALLLRESEPVVHRALQVGRLPGCKVGKTWPLSRRAVSRQVRGLYDRSAER